MTNNKEIDIKAKSSIDIFVWQKYTIIDGGEVYMAKAGRPKAEVTKEKVISVRVKPQDYSEIKQYAESSNKTITQVMQEGVMKLIRGE